MCRSLGMAYAEFTRDFLPHYTIEEFAGPCGNAGRLPFKTKIPRRLLAHQALFLASCGARHEDLAFFAVHVQRVKEPFFLAAVDVRKLKFQIRDLVLEQACARHHHDDVDVILRTGVPIDSMTWENGCRYAMAQMDLRLLHILVFWMGSDWVDYLNELLEV